MEGSVPGPGDRVIRSRPVNQEEPPIVTVAPFRALTFADGVRTQTATAVPADSLADPPGGPHVVGHLVGADGATIARRWLRDGTLQLHDQPALWGYEVTDRGGTRRGLLAALAVHDRLVMGHERTDDVVVDDRRARLAAVPLDVTPVMVVTHTTAPLVAAPGPTATTVHLGDTTHRVWPLTTEAGNAAVAHLRGAQGLIADGHHRWSAAAAHAPLAPTDDAAQRTLGWVLPAAPGPSVGAVHRVVDVWPDGADTRIDAGWVRTTWTGAPEALVTGTAEPVRVGLITPDGAWVLTPRQPASLAERLGSADLARIAAVVTDRALAADVGATAAPAVSLDQALADLRGGAVGAVLVCAAPELDTIWRAAAAGTTLSAKATSFSPKPAAGLVMRSASATWPHPAAT